MANILTPRLPQSNGEILYGAVVNGYAVANGYKTQKEAREAAEQWARENGQMAAATWIDTALFSVCGGKFHKPAGPIHRSQSWCPTRTACGVTVTPLNYFVTTEDASQHTGGRLAAHMCKRCASK